MSSGAHRVLEGTMEGARRRGCASWVLKENQGVLFRSHGVEELSPAGLTHLAVPARPPPP